MKVAQALAALLAVLALVVGRDARGTPVTFDIPAGSAARTLPAFEQRSGLDLQYPDLADLQRFDTRAVNGTYEPIDALRLMLSGLSLLAVPRKSYVAVVDCAAPADGRLYRACGAKRRLEAAKARGAAKPAAVPRPADMEELVVTGTIMRGAEKSPSVITLSNRDIESRTPRGAIWEALQDQPAVHGSGPTEDTSEIGTDAPTNSGRGIGINLRGFGAGATLVLVNGHRIAASGTDAAFTDISNVSNLFVEETELLADATSAVYGSDAVAGVVNLNLRRSFDGAVTRARYGGAAGDELDHFEIGQLFGWNGDRTRTVVGVNFHSSGALAASSRAQARSDLTRWGGSNFDINLSNPGNVFTPDGALAIPHGQDGSNLALSDLIAGRQNLTDRHAHSDLISAQRIASAYASVQFAPRTNLTLSLDGHFAFRRASAQSGSAALGLVVPFANPFAKQIATPLAPVLVSYNFFDDLGALRLRANVRSDFVTGSLEYRGENGWTIGGYARRATERQHQVHANFADPTAVRDALADESPATALNPFGDGSFTAAETLERIRTTGHTFARSRTSSMGVDASGRLGSILGRDLRLGVGLDYRDQTLRSDIRTGGISPDSRFARSRDAFALVTELDLTAAERLDLSFAGRYETFLGSGDAFTSRIEARWTPWDSVTVFTNWSDSFRLPPLGQLDESQNGSVLQTAPDPQSPSGATVALVEFGKNSELEPETAKSWSAGVRIDSPLAGVQVRLSYFDVNIRDRIESTAFSNTLLADPEFAHLVTRNPSPARQAEVCQRTRFVAIAGSCQSASINAILDLRLRNIAVLESRGIEMNGRWTRNAFTVDLNATRLIDYEQAQTPREPLIERVDLQHQPIDFKFVGGATWQRRNFSATAIVNFVDSYHDRQTDIERRVGAWTTYDVSLVYFFADDLSATLVGTNVLNENPPFFNNAFAGFGYDAENADVKGRQLALSVQKSW
jgi:iron complex outermembrane receptor protein